MARFLSFLKQTIKRIAPLYELALKIDRRLYQHYQEIFNQQQRPKDEAWQQQLQQLQDQITSAAENESIYIKFVPPGHYYSPIPSLSELQAGQERIFSLARQDLPGVQLDDQKMLAYLEQFKPFYSEFPFHEQKTSEFRFFMDNDVYSRGDAVILFSMIRYLKPRRIIEVGSGCSTCLMLDVNERFMEQALSICCIDPHPERMYAMLREGDLSRVQVLNQELQEIDMRIFNTLEANDIVFFDSTHVVKCDSDVNHIFFDVLPACKPGVYFHFHDIFYPFEYPKQWLLEIGAAWNESYFLRAFLQYNSAFEVVFFSDYMTRFHRAELEASIPIFLRGPGSSFWLRKLGA